MHGAHRPYRQATVHYSCTCCMHNIWFMHAAQCSCTHGPTYTSTYDLWFCSQSGWCGMDEAWCGSTCNAVYGTCNAKPGVNNRMPQWVGEVWFNNVWASSGHVKAHAWCYVIVVPDPSTLWTGSWCEFPLLLPYTTSRLLVQLLAWQSWSGQLCVGAARLAYWCVYRLSLQQPRLCRYLPLHSDVILCLYLCVMPIHATDVESYYVLVDKARRCLGGSGSEDQTHLQMLLDCTTDPHQHWHVTKLDGGWYVCTCANEIECWEFVLLAGLAWQAAYLSCWLLIMLICNAC